MLEGRRVVDAEEQVGAAGVDHGARSEEHIDTAWRPNALSVHGIQRLVNAEPKAKTTPILGARTWEGVKAIFQ